MFEEDPDLEQLLFTENDYFPIEPKLFTYFGMVASCKSIETVK